MNLLIYENENKTGPVTIVTNLDQLEKVLKEFDNEGKTVFFCSTNEEKLEHFAVEIAENGKTTDLSKNNAQKLEKVVSNDWIRSEQLKVEKDTTKIKQVSLSLKEQEIIDAEFEQICESIEISSSMKITSMKKQFIKFAKKNLSFEDDGLESNC